MSPEGGSPSPRRGETLGGYGGCANKRLKGVEAPSFPQKPKLLRAISDDRSSNAINRCVSRRSKVVRRWFEGVIRHPHYGRFRVASWRAGRSSSLRISPRSNMAFIASSKSAFLNPRLTLSLANILGA